MNNTKLTCPTCGKWGYFDTSVQPVTCRFCGENLDPIPPAPKRQTQTDKFNRRYNRTEPEKPVLADADSPIHRTPEDSQERQFVSFWTMELSRLRRENTPVVIFMTNGYQIQGTIANYERECVIVLSDGVRKICPRHAISTIQPKV